MVLNDIDIEQRINSDGLLGQHTLQNIKNCGYSLRAGQVFQPRTGNEEVLNQISENNKSVMWEIGPSESLIIKTKETVKMPADLCGTYAPLYHLSSQGVMLLNASIVEPGYEGPLSCFLVNFSSQRVSLGPEEKVAKIVFHKLTSTPAALNKQVISDADYQTELVRSAKKFPKSFLDISGVEERAADRATNAVKKWVVIGGILVAFLTLWGSLEGLLSRFLWEKTGIYTTSQRVEDVKLLKDLDSAKLKTDIEELRREIQALKKSGQKAR